RKLAVDDVHSSDAVIEGGAPGQPLSGELQIVDRAGHFVLNRDIVLDIDGQLRAGGRGGGKKVIHQPAIDPTPAWEGLAKEVGGEGAFIATVIIARVEALEIELAVREL